MAQVIPQTSPDYDQTRVIERPDGFYWQTIEGREYGPFTTLLEAVLDMQAADDELPEPGETLGEAEAELGIADWVDPDTGALAEEERPRIRDD
jgi:hypothetical protein